LPKSTFVLLDGRTERANDLAAAVAELGLCQRVSVVGERAEEAAHRSGLRSTFDAVVARAFGPPAVTAECGAGFLVPGGILVVSEPPEDSKQERWPEKGISKFDLVLESTTSTPFHFAVLRSVAPLDLRYPRRVGIPAKRRLF
jgi:16S rRNA (guanine527-N7)-methyltransferase